MQFVQSVVICFPRVMVETLRFPRFRFSHVML